MITQKKIMSIEDKNLPLIVSNAFCLAVMAYDMIRGRHNKQQT